jgi:DNA-binding Lrp family transcriptional regulator
LITGYHATLNAAELGSSTTAYLRFLHMQERGENCFSTQSGKKIADFPEVQEVHITSGEWDILIKVKANNVDSIGKFVVDKLRLVKGI